MRAVDWRLGIALAFVLAAACRPAARPSANPAAHPLAVKRQRLLLGKDTVMAEVAATEEMRAVGLMFRKVMAENEGMLFVFD